MTATNLRVIPIVVNNYVMQDLIPIIEEQINNNEFEERYFPNILSMDKVEFTSSIPLTTCICLGWDDFTYEYVEELQWVCTFRDLTSEGRKLYYSIKKLHNNKEVRILTFNNI